MASKKGKRARSRARKGGARGGSRRRSRGSSSMGGVSLFFVGAIITFGGVILAKLCKLPLWLSPVGAALWLYGWWKNNAFLRTLGLLYIGTGIAAVMGLPDQASKAIDDMAKKDGGFLGGLFNVTKSSGPSTPSQQGGGSGGIKDVADAIDDVVDVIDSGRGAYNTLFA